MRKDIQLYKGDCLEVMDKLIENGIKVDMVLTDLPYGTTARNRWDVIIPFSRHMIIEDKIYYQNEYSLYCLSKFGDNPELLNKELGRFKVESQEGMWDKINKITNERSPILLFADEPFTSNLIVSNPKMFKQRITWNKDRGSGFLNAKRMLLKTTEDVCLFYKKAPIYNPQMTDAPLDRIRPKNKGSSGSSNYGEVKEIKSADGYDPNKRYPMNLVKFSSIVGDCNNVNRSHPTQKPVEFLEWLIKTYSDEGQVVLDFTMGVGSTGVACLNTNRGFIGVELDGGYFEIARERVGEIYETRNS